MSSRSKKLVTLAREHEITNNNKTLTCPQKTDKDLIRQLENDPNFINKLPILLIDHQNVSTQPDQNDFIFIEPQLNNKVTVDNNINTNSNDFTKLSCPDASSSLQNFEFSTLSNYNNESVIGYEIETQDTTATCSLENDFDPINELNYNNKSFIENEIETQNTTVTCSTENDFDTINEPGSSAERPESNFSDTSNEGFRLVNYSENSDSDNQSENFGSVKRKRRKRCLVDKSTWVYEENRKKRETGQRYFGKKKDNNIWNNKVLKPPRTLKTRCKCKERGKECKIRCSLITEENRQNIFSTFWKMTWGEKKIYVDALVQIIPTQRHRDRKNESVTRRHCSVIYNLRKDEKLIRVCKTMFLNTLCIGKWCVLNWKETRPKQSVHKRQNEEEVNSIPSTEIKRAKKFNSFELENKEMNAFIDNLPTMESHYCRASTDKKYIIPDWSTKKALYDFYVNNWCKERNVKALSVCSFNTAMDLKNMSLYHPKKDQCQICFSHKLGQYSEEAHALHIEKKKEARKEKEKDKETEKYVFTMDLQAVLLAPRSNVSSLYYRTKLCVHNFCLFNLKTHQGTCYLWNESEGGLNAEEFVTIVVKFLLDKVIPALQEENTNENKKVILYSDGCTYQNRNATMSNALLNLAITNKVIIEQKFLEVGHTQMEADSMHASIEKQLKNKIINVPAEYIQVCRTARKHPEPYSVHYLTHDFFKNFKDVMFFKSIRPGKMKGDPKVTDLRAIQYNPDGSIFFKLRFEDDWSILPQRKDNKVTTKLWNELPDLYATRRKIKKKKFEDLQELKKVIPSDYHEYYDNIPFEN